MYDIYWFGFIMTATVAVVHAVARTVNWADNRDRYTSNKTKAHNAMWALRSIAIIPLVFVWPLFAPALIVFGLYRLYRALRVDMSLTE